MCQRCYQKLWYEENPGKHAKASKKWRKKHKRAIRVQRKRYYGEGVRWAKKGHKPYNHVDLQMIIGRFTIDGQGDVVKENASDQEIAQYIGRSIAAVQSQRCTLKKGPA